MTIGVPGLPALEWTPVEGSAECAVDETTFDDARLVLTADAGTDWTNDAFGGPQQHAATSLGFFPQGDFSLSARVRVLSDRTTFDAGVLAIWGDRDHWAKLCFEFSPQGEAMVVSVVTNQFSDDCNSTLVPEDHVHLRIIRSGDGWAFHSSTDGRAWRFVRVFRLETDGPVHVGFLAQSPTGSECVAAFDDIVYRNTVPADLRDGG